MKEEIEAASQLLVSFMQKGTDKTDRLSDKVCRELEMVLRKVFIDRFREHWHPDEPIRGNGYRCLRINGKMDRILSDAIKTAGLDEIKVRSLMPRELTIWIDPHEVCYRIGENGSICAHFRREHELHTPPRTPTARSLVNQSPEPPSAPIKNQYSREQLPRTPPSAYNMAIAASSPSAISRSSPAVASKYSTTQLATFNCKDFAWANVIPREGIFVSS